MVTVQTVKAHWVNRDTIAWIGAESTGTYRLYHSPTGQITDQMSEGALRGSFVPLLVDRNGLPQWIVEKFPFLKDATALKISEEDLAQVPGLLKGELVLAKMNNAASAEATTLILAGVLDDLFYFDGELGAQRSGDEIRFRLWAPTARSVRLFVYDDPDEAAREIYPMSEGDAGVWEVRVGDPSWLNRKYYVYEVEVFSRQHARIVTNVVTDPYSFGLAPNSSKSLVVDFDSPFSKPDSWNLIPKPELASPTDIVLYELHIRDFSISDQTVPEKDRGKYTAFTHIFSNGMLHLWGLATAGLTHVHLLPAFDFTSVPELAAEQKLPQFDPTILAAGFDRATNSDWGGKRPGRVQLGL